jgi:hypothetical protein
MISPKEEAKELVDKMSNQTYTYQEYAGAHYTTCEIGYEAGVKCALIAVDKILKVAFYNTDNLYEHYMQVKQEITKL